MDIDKLNWKTSIGWKTHIKTKYLLGQHNNHAKIPDYNSKTPVLVSTAAHEQIHRLRSATNATDLDKHSIRMYNAHLQYYKVKHTIQQLLDQGLLEVKI